jgi:hypothetical protein
VLRTDVKSYYASIDHLLLMDRLARWIRDPAILNLLGQYLRRTAESGGWFWDCERGISLGCLNGGASSSSCSSRPLSARIAPAIGAGEPDGGAGIGAAGPFERVLPFDDFCAGVSRRGRCRQREQNWHCELHG